MAGIYLHIPFCKQACYYCDFHFSASLKHKEAMLLAIQKEIVFRKKELEKETVETIYFGGGTPSILEVAEISKLLQLITQNYSVSSEVEITLEANPDDLSLKKLQALAKTPINRLSIGIQSFFEDDLQFMNRAHTVKQAKECLQNAKKYFNNITIDLIYGVPNMTTDKWKQNLTIAFNLNIPHISSYALTVEKKTALHSFIKKGKLPPLEEELALQHFKILVAEAEKIGYRQYEISNFSKPNYFSKHNTSYWLGKKYLGIGPSAHSYNKKERLWNVSNNIKYIKSLAKDKIPQQVEILTDLDKYNEYIMTGLRTIWGVSLQTVKTNFGIQYYDYLLKNSQRYLQEGLLSLKNKNTLLVTQKGKFLTDGIISDLFKV